MSEVEKFPKTGEDQLPTFNPEHFTNEEQPQLYSLFFKNGSTGVPRKDLEQIYNSKFPLLSLKARLGRLNRDFKHLRTILGEHYGYEVKDTTPKSQHMRGKQAHYIMQRIQKR